MCRCFQLQKSGFLKEMWRSGQTTFTMIKFLFSSFHFQGKTIGVQSIVQHPKSQKSDQIQTPPKMGWCDFIEYSRCTERLQGPKRYTGNHSQYDFESNRRCMLQIDWAKLWRFSMWFFNDDRLYTARWFGNHAVVLSIPSSPKVFSICLFI